MKTKAEAIAKLKARGAEVITGDINSADDLSRAFTGFDTVVSAVGRGVLGAQVQLAELADKHPDVKRFFPSEYGTDIEYDASSANEKPHQFKLKVRAALRGLKNLEYTCIVTGPYANADFGLYFGATPSDKEEWGTFDVKRQRAVMLGNGDDKVSFTTMNDTAKFVVGALKHLPETRNRILIVNSFTTTPRQIVTEFEKQTGKKWDVSNTSLDQLKKLEEEAWGRGEVLAGAVTLKRIWTSGKTLYDHRDNSVLGVDQQQLDTLEDAVGDAIKWQNATK